jgi:hypothetical protein
MEAAREVSESPMVETNCPVHKKVKLRFRKTAKGDDDPAAVDVISMPSLLLWILGPGFRRTGLYISIYPAMK